MSYADYIYKNVDDTIRVRVVKKTVEKDYGASSESYWDFDVFRRDGDAIETYSDSAGDVFRTKADAVREMKRLFGPMKSINVSSVTKGW